MYAKLIEGVAIEYTRVMLQAEYPNTSFPLNPPDETLAEYGVYPVIQTPPPVIDEMLEVVNGYEIVHADGIFTQQWIVRPLTAEEQAQKIKEKELEEDADTVANDPDVNALLSARPEQIESYIENNVTDIASMKHVLTIVAKAVGVLSRQQGLQ